MQTLPRTSIRPIVPAAALLSAVTALAFMLWLAFILHSQVLGFVLINPRAKTGFEVSIAAARLLFVLVLLLFPDERLRPRLRWIAAGFFLLAIAGLVFGYLAYAIGRVPSPNTQLYVSLVTLTVGTSLIAVGLVPGKAIVLSWPSFGLLLFATVALSVVPFTSPSSAPLLIHGGSLEAMANRGGSYLSGLTPFYWAWSCLPVVFSTIAAIAAVRRLAGEYFRAWLTEAMTLMAGANLHNMFWPSAYTSIFTTASLLRLGSTVVIAVGSVLELRRIAAERDAQLAIERDYSARLIDLAVLKADFTAMIGHELASPLAAIQRAAEFLGTSSLDHQDARALEVIHAECASLNALVHDVRESARAERHDFSVKMRPTPVAEILADVTSFAHALPDTHPWTIETIDAAIVRADPERIGQVLRNLLSNAVQYTPALGRHDGTAPRMGRAGGAARSANAAARRKRRHDATMFRGLDRDRRAMQAPRGPDDRPARLLRSALRRGVRLVRSVSWLSRHDRPRDRRDQAWWPDDREVHRRRHLDRASHLSTEDRPRRTQSTPPVSITSGPARCV